MTNPKYQVTISYVPTYKSGVDSSGLGIYSGGYYVAAMNEILITGTGSSYANALTAVLAVATNTNDNGHSPLSY